MSKFTSNEKINGELAVQQLSEKAQETYNNTDEFNVYEYEEDGVKKYAYTSCMGSCEGLTLRELEQELESLGLCDEEF